MSKSKDRLVSGIDDLLPHRSPPKILAFLRCCPPEYLPIIPDVSAELIAERQHAEGQSALADTSLNALDSTAKLTTGVQAGFYGQGTETFHII